ncbi:MAG TPA: hypothetical protein VK099_04940 [Alcanivoracaceae bacterium]|nr:hypothetical protein [Alcanivoracaceae bacterium]
MKLRTILAAAIIAAPIAATAAPLSYTYGEATYQAWTDSDIDSHNWALKGSYQIGDNYYFTAEDAYLAADGKGRSGGLGVFAPIDNNVHVYGQLSLADSNPKRETDNSSKLNGVRPIVELGARAALNDQLEARLAARYINDGAYSSSGKLKDEWVFQAEGVYAVSNKVDVLASVAAPLENSGAVITAGARFNF